MRKVAIGDNSEFLSCLLESLGGGGLLSYVVLESQSWSFFSPTACSGILRKIGDKSLLVGVRKYKGVIPVRYAIVISVKELLTCELLEVGAKLQKLLLVECNGFSSCVAVSDAAAGKTLTYVTSNRSLEKVRRDEALGFRSTSRA